MDFDVIGAFRDIETIALGGGIRERARLRKPYGSGRWRKKKAVATIRLGNGGLWVAELPWYEAHGIGRRELKVERLLRDLP